VCQPEALAATEHPLRPSVEDATSFLVGGKIAGIGFADRLSNFPTEPGVVGNALLGGMPKHVIDKAVDVGRFASCSTGTIPESGQN